VILATFLLVFNNIEIQQRELLNNEWQDYLAPTKNLLNQQQPDFVEIAEYRRVLEQRNHFSRLANKFSKNLHQLQCNISGEV